jgi:periplasmic protein TonB
LLNLTAASSAFTGPRPASLALGTDPDPLAPAANNGAFTVALAFSLVFHSVLLLITFAFPDSLASKNLPKSIEVVLVNSKSHTRPVKADAIAQADLDGGGNTQEARRAKTNLPALPDMPPDADVALASKRVQQLESEAQRLMTQLQAGNQVVQPQTVARDPVLAPDAPVIADTPQEHTEIARLEAQIAREWEAYQELPKRKFIGSRTQGAIEAQYLDSWRQRIERVGTANFPEDARRQGVFGTVMVTVAVRADGSVEQIDIDRSSGSPILDAAVERIVHLAGPFKPFPDALRKEADILHITRNWSFTRSDVLVTTGN